MIINEDHVQYEDAGKPIDWGLLLLCLTGIIMAIMLICSLIYSEITIKAEGRGPIQQKAAVTKTNLHG